LDKNNKNNEDDRMKDLKIITTSCGNTGSPALIQMLKRNYSERKIEIIGIDSNENACGRFFVDKFYQVPKLDSSDSKEYIYALLDIVEKENPDLIYPTSTQELLPLALYDINFDYYNCPILIGGSYYHMEVVTDKIKTFNFLKKHGYQNYLPNFGSAKSFDEFLNIIEDLGYYDGIPIVFKSSRGSGSKCVRIMDINHDNHKKLLYGKPIATHISLDEMLKIFKFNDVKFPELLVMEVVEGQETEVDLIGKNVYNKEKSLWENGKTLFTMTRTVENALGSTIMLSETVDNPELELASVDMQQKLNLNYLTQFTYVGDKLIEIDARIGSIQYQPDLILPYELVKYALGEVDDEHMINLKQKVIMGNRMVRYYNQIMHTKNEMIF
jgi:biotin carboxylase